MPAATQPAPGRALLLLRSESELARTDLPLEQTELLKFALRSQARGEAHD